MHRRGEACLALTSSQLLHARFVQVPLQHLVASARQLLDVVVDGQVGAGEGVSEAGDELQAQVHGGLTRKTQQKLDQLGAGKTETSDARPGMRLVREWNGKLHVVTVGEDKVIRWNDKEWNSLSEVARAITGTRWSGPAFFGLKQKRAAA